MAHLIPDAVPLHACDDEAACNTAQRLLPQRRIWFRDVEEEGDFEDVDGYLWHSMQRDD